MAAVIATLPLSGPSDADVIAGSLSDPQAFGEIFDRHHDAIHAWLRRRVGAALAEELAADTFVRAFDARARYAPLYADARPWLYGIAANLARRHHRSEERRLRAYARSGIEVAGDPIEAVADRVDARAESRAIAAALAGLKPRDRDALLLFAWADLSYEEIASATAVPVGTVRSRIHRARAHVRADLEMTP
jgi:RNA polymerase sigma-70 factor (ECF subfamily)